MDRSEAKEVLARYRPGETFGDPQVGEALELARRDPQLAEWFAKQRAAHVAGTQVLPEVAPAQPERKPFISKPALAIFFIVVALLLLMLIWTLNTPKPKDPFINYRDRMVRLVYRAYPMQINFSDQAQIRDYFRTNAGPVDYSLPRNLEKLPAKGCAMFTWANHPVAMMGFDAGGNTNLSLFLISRSAFDDTPVPAAPEYALVRKLLTVSWTSGGRVYLLAGPNDPALLRNHLE
jgi:hypothetical protein